MQVRKVQGLVGEQSFAIVLPKHYATNLQIGKGDYVKVTQKNNRIIVEKAQIGENEEEQQS
jgi:antitoxin component of MazEF toxin-antitoxin module